jgi:hypothetical protein
MTMASTENPNRAILDEANSAKAWFHAKKNRPIWTKLIDRDQVIRTLEGDETVQAGHILCRGEAGEIWPQTAAQLAKRYLPTGEADASGWRKQRPHPNAQGVLATVIPHSFTVVTAWGTLTGQPGDLMMKNFADRDEPFPTEVWIVAAKLFAATYEEV